MTDKDIDDRAELVVRRYFDHYLEDVFPIQVRLMIKAHDGDRKAHGSAERKINRIVYGIAAIVGVLGVLVTLKALGW